jgi:hypothetical protein
MLNKAGYLLQKVLDENYNTEKSWELKPKTRDEIEQFLGALPIAVVIGSDSKEQIITQLLDKLHVEAKGKKIKEYNNMIACSYGVVTIDIKIK